MEDCAYYRYQKKKIGHYFYNLIVMKSIFTTIIIAASLLTKAQDTTKTDLPQITISGFIDSYYSYNFNKSSTTTKLPFLYNYNRHNEFNVNIALLRAAVSYENVYARIAMQAGSYVEQNYANEDLKLLNEAYVGLYLNASKTTTVEVGILPSYIGFETAISHSNLTVTRSILAENSPYFMTGLKLNHQFTSKLSGALLVTNGWQRIKKANATLTPSFGTQLVYKPSAHSMLNWSTFLGKEAINDTFAMRYFSNLFWDYSWNHHWKTILGFDYGVQDVSTANQAHAIWYSPVVIAQYKINSKWNVAYRTEYYQDKENVIIATKLPFQTLGNSLNFDFLPNSKCKIRAEGKWYSAMQKEVAVGTNKNTFLITTTMSFEF